MSVIEVNRNPSPRELRIFGLLFLAFGGMLGAVVLWRWQAPSVARWIWSTGAIVAALYFLIPALRRPVYLGWSYLTLPIGFVVSHVILALVFYGVVTPTGLVLRAIGRDPMARRFEPDRPSYWVAHPGPPDPERYFRQY